MRYFTLSLCFVLIFAGLNAQESGDLDITFGNQGVVVQDVFGANAEVKDMEVTAEGKILVLASNTNGDAILAMFGSDGGLDLSFSTDGFVVVDFSIGVDRVNALELQSDGKILVVGSTKGSGTTFDMMIMRLTASGQLDTAFSTDGKVVYNATNNLDDEAFDVALQADGKIVMAGYSNGLNSNFHWVKLNADGSYNDDASSDINGGYDVAYKVLVDADNRILLGGNGQSESNFVVARYTPAGLLDSSFGNGGKAILNVGTSDVVRDLAIQEDGKIICCGGQGQNFTVLRFLSNGNIDVDFSPGGFQYGFVLPDCSGDTGAEALAIQADGKIVAAGGNTLENCVARINMEGTMDNTFGTNGVGTYPQTMRAKAIKLVDGGKILVAGTFFQNGNWDIGLMRIWPGCSMPEGAGAIFGPTEICPNTEATFYIDEVSGATSYNWSIPPTWSGSSNSNSITVEIGTTGTSIGVWPVNACGTGTLSDMMIDILDAPPTPVISQSGNLLTCNLNSLIYQWYLNGNPIAGAINSTYEISQSGNYSVSVQYAFNDCEVSSVVTNYNFVGVSEIAAEAAWTIYPNPANEIVYTNAPGQVEFSLYSADGKFIRSEKLTSGQVSLDGLAPGIYFYSLKSSVQANAGRLIVVDNLEK